MTGIVIHGSMYCEACDKAKKLIESTNPKGHGFSVEYVDMTENPGGPLPRIWIGDDGPMGYDEARIRSSLSKLYGPEEEKPIAQPQTWTSHETLVFALFVAVGFFSYRQFYA